MGFEALEIMATITRGKYKGRTCQLHQWCNDWFSVEILTGTDRLPKIVSPTSLRLTPREILKLRPTECGTMFREFELLEDGTFKRRRHRFPRAVAPAKDRGQRPR